MGKGQAKPILYKKETRAVFGCSWPTQFWEATVVFETGFPKPEPGTPTVRFLCEERTPPWKTMGPVWGSHHREATYYMLCAILNKKYIVYSAYFNFLHWASRYFSGSRQ